MRTQARSLRAAVLGTVALIVLGTLLASPSGGSAHSASPAALAPSSGAAHVALRGSVLTDRPLTPSPAGPHPAAFSVSIVGTTPDAAALSWSSPGAIGFYSYTVYVSSNGSGGPYQSVGVINSQSTTSFALGGLTPGATYFWEVSQSAIIGSQTSSPSNGTQPSLAFLNVTNPSPTSARFNWTNNATYGGSLTFVGYTIYESANGGSPQAVAWVNNSSVESVTLTGLTGGASYSFFLNTTDCISGCGTAGASNVSTLSNTVTLGTPLALLASVSTQRSVVDVGEPAYFVCTPSGGTSPFNFSWDFGTGRFVKGPSSESWSFTAAAPNVPVACLVTDHRHVQSSAGTSITVNEDPVVAALLNRSHVDVGQSIAFDCTAGGGTAPVNVAWTFGDGQQFSGGATDHTYARAGTFPATCTASDGTGTTETSSAAVVVSPLLDVLCRASTSAVAPGGAVTFTALPANGSGSYTTYLWNFGDGATGAGAVAHHSYPSAGNYSASVSVEDSNGMNVTARTAVTVSAIVLVVRESGASIAPGGTVTFTASATGGAGGPYRFTWSFGDGVAGAGPSVTHTFATAGTFHPTVQVLDRLNSTASSPLSAVGVSTPPSPTSWFGAWVVLLLALILGVAVGLFAYTIHRRRESVEHERYAGYVPPSDPSRVVKGVRVCRVCGTSNAPIRETCAHCGASLPRSSPR